MHDVILWAQVDDPTPMVTTLTWPDPSYMYLEQVPGEWIHNPKMDAGLGLRRLDITLDFQHWERGRIFCTDWELRWEKQDAQYTCVYVGIMQDLPGFSLETEISLAQAERIPNSYYLWGTLVSEGDYAIMGAVSEPGTQIFIELRIPRLLRYPVSQDVHRVKLITYDYIDPNSGQLLYQRYWSIEEEK